MCIACARAQDGPDCMRPIFAKFVCLRQKVRGEKMVSTTQAREILVVVAAISETWSPPRRRRRDGTGRNIETIGNIKRLHRKGVIIFSGQDVSKKRKERGLILGPCFCLYPPEQALKESGKVARWRQPYRVHRTRPRRGSGPPETVQGSRRVRNHTA